MKNKNLFPAFALLILALSITCNMNLFAGNLQESENSGKVIKVTAASYKKEIAKGIVLVDFWAQWCGPCRMMNPILNDIAGEMKDSVKIAKFNVDENKRFAIEKGISSIPLIIVYKDGKEIDRITGVVSREELKAVIRKHYK